ncbi:unnamed protein product [Echinostoma caproni]|uniref:Reverse transcriptase domain-containing protein n=1 Tax=Echinostoma caproni TaxID=27848 RepID=A0A183A0P5_9TREM|nr:unnamed protein product [Echinostoma caproni]
MEIALFSREESDIDLPPGGRLPDLEYADDTVLLSEDAGETPLAEYDIAGWLVDDRHEHRSTTK